MSRLSLPQRNGVVRLRVLRGTVLWTLLALVACAAVRADEPYARSRDYDLQNARMALHFDLEQRRVLGEVTHTLAPLREGVTKLEFDSVDLTIASVTVAGKLAKFETPKGKLRVILDKPARAGEKLTIHIKYEGRPKKGLYFVLPDKNYPNRPAQVWTQGQAEDTRYYIPIYDYPNDQTATEMILTVPKEWVTVSNGKLMSVKEVAGGMKTWHWKQSKPHSTYLISIVAGQYAEAKEMWRNIPVTYYAPKDRAERITPTFKNTTKMLDFFSDKLGVLYPWDKYAQSTVDDFVAGGMENTSATTNTAGSLVHPQLARESVSNADGLISHEMAHQWFGDLVTCKDWGHAWLNEGFATYFGSLWTEHYYGADNFAYDMWQSRNGWMQQQQLFTVPIVNHNFTSMTQYSGNIYTKGGWVLHMLRGELGDADFFRGLKHYLDKHRHQNVVTADLTKAIYEATGKNVDPFFDQWVHGAGAPKFEVSYSYDDAAKQVKLDVKQTQKVEGAVGLFRVPVEVEISTSTGKNSHTITVSKASETFTFPADSAPLLVLFDKGNKVLKSAAFKKEAKEWIHQLKYAESVADRADAVQELAKVKDSAEVIGALGEAAQRDKFWGIRVQSLRALGQIGGAEAQKQIKAALGAEQPWVRGVAVQLMGNFKEDATAAETLEKIFREDKALRVRTAALMAFAQQKPKNGYDVMKEAAAMDSIDDAIRAAAIRGFGVIGEEKAVPILLEATAPGKPMTVRTAAIGAVARMDKKNKHITKKLLEYLDEPGSSPQFQFALFGSLVERDDTDAVAPLEAWMNRSEFALGRAQFIRPQLERLKSGGQAPRPGAPAAQPGAAAAAPAAPPDTAQMMQMGQQILQQLEALRKENAEIRERLKKIEEKVVGEKKP